MKHNKDDIPLLNCTSYGKIMKADKCGNTIIVS